MQQREFARGDGGRHCVLQFANDVQHAMVEQLKWEGWWWCAIKDLSEHMVDENTPTKMLVLPTPVFPRLKIGHFTDTVTVYSSCSGTTYYIHT